jgi:hydrogenase expression/formation protein HypC
MCLAVPGKIIETHGDVALVDFQGNRMEVSRVLTPEARPDDWVLVHAGFAIATIDEAEAKETWSYLNAMSEAESADALGEAEVSGE